MSDNVVIPAKVWQNLLNDLDYLKKVVTPLAKGHKASKWMTEEEVLEALKIGKRRLHQLRQSGQIRYNKPVHGWVKEYLRVDIEDYKQGNIIIPSNKKAPALTEA